MAFMVAGGGGGLKRVSDPDKMGDRVWDNSWVNDYGNLVLIANETESYNTDMYGYEHQLYAERCHHYMDVEVEGETATYTAYRTNDGSVIKEYTRTRKV